MGNCVHLRWTRTDPQSQDYEKVYPFLSKQPPQKIEILSSPSPFGKFGRTFTLPPPLPHPHAAESGRGAHYDFCLLKKIRSLALFKNFQK